jgi:hypothetical protein
VELEVKVKVSLPYREVVPVVVGSAVRIIEQQYDVYMSVSLRKEIHWLLIVVQPIGFLVAY